MRLTRGKQTLRNCSAIVVLAYVAKAFAIDVETNSVSGGDKSPAPPQQNWNWHFQNTVIVQGYLNRAHMGSYQAAIDNPSRPAEIEATRTYRHKYGFGLNIEQELAKNVGIFSRVGWSDGANEAWTFADVDRTATLGVSVKGESWHRPNDTYGLAGVINGISHVHRRFFSAGGTGILAGDGALSYAPEEILETYYDFHIYKSLRAALDYQFVNHPAFNRDRGPVSVFGGRLHWEF